MAGSSSTGGSSKKKKSSGKSSSSSSSSVTIKRVSKFSPSYLATTQPKAPKTYKNTAEAPKNWKNTYTAPKYKNNEKAPSEYNPGTYNSKYQDQLDSSLDKVVNWEYDPMQDANYQALAAVYGARGNLAAKNSLADAAALNGGYGTSYAVSAAQQARNQYNQELAALMPDLEQTAYSRAANTLNALREADDTDYGRFRDTEGDRQWKWSQDYNAYRDRVADNQWLYSQKYDAYRDKVGDSQWNWTNKYNKWRDLTADNQWAWTQRYNSYRDAMSDYQWALGQNMDLWQYNQQQAKAASSGGGGGGGRRSSGGGGGGYVASGSSTSGSGMPDINLSSDRDRPKAGPTMTKGYTLDKLLAEGKKDKWKRHQR